VFHRSPRSPRPARSDQTRPGGRRPGPSRSRAARVGVTSTTLLAASALAVAAAPALAPLGERDEAADRNAVTIHRTSVSAADAEVLRAPRRGGFATATWLLGRTQEVAEQRALVPDLERLVATTPIATAGDGDDTTSASAAAPVYHGSDGETIDAERLRSWLEGRGSPLAPYADDFVAAGIAHDVDPRLVIGIAAIESTVGEQLPPGSHNAWGWGGSGPHGLAAWPSWPVAIDAFTERLGALYDTEVIDERMARTYCPPNWRAWLDTVRWVFDDI
jgi:hypothetical protein